MTRKEFENVYMSIHNFKFIDIGDDVAIGVITRDEVRKLYGAGLKIFGDFERRTCENCKLLGEIDNPCKVLSIAMEEFLLADVGNFKCGKWESK